MLIKKLPTISTLVSLLATPLTVFGVISPSSAPSTACGIIALIENIANTLAYAVGVIAIIMLLYSAFLFVTQSGSEDGIAKAKTYLIYALIGLAVAIFAFNARAIVSGLIGSNVALLSCIQ